VVKKSLEQRKTKQMIVFAETKKTMEKICDVLRESEIKSLPYHQDIPV
jgi:superfamily II DNA/RNA helicase